MVSRYCGPHKTNFPIQPGNPYHMVPIFNVFSLINLDFDIKRVWENRMGLKKPARTPVSKPMQNYVPDNANFNNNHKCDRKKVIKRKMSS